MRRLQIYLEEDLDDRLAAEAERRGLSKAALVRRAVSEDLGSMATGQADPWAALVGWRDDDPVEDIDQMIYGGHG